MSAASICRWPEIAVPSVQRIFFYGLFMDAALLRGMGYRPAVIGPACLRNFRIHIGHKATLVSDAGAIAYGIVMDLPTDDATALYSGDSVTEYVAESVEAELLKDASIHNALCYNLPPNAVTQAANRAYADALSKLVREQGFPADYAAEIAGQSTS